MSIKAPYEVDHYSLEMAPPMIVLGYKGDRVGNPYIVTIRSHDRSYENILIVKAVMQEDIQMRVSSRWEPVGRSSFFGGKVEAAIQEVWGASTVFAWGSRRLWQGTSPITINLNLKFEAEDDEIEEVVKPTLALQQLVLPGRGVLFEGGNWLSKLVVKGFGTGDKLYKMYPPGPSPFNLGGREIITIKIGNFLTFESVVVKEAAVRYAPKFTTRGKPISSSIDLQFETYQIVTKDELYSIYNNVFRRKRVKKEEAKVEPSSRVSKDWESKMGEYIEGPRSAY